MELESSYSCTRSFSQSDFERFAALSGDDNPIHVDPAFAQRTKFGRTVAHGMLLYAFISSCVNEFLPGTYQTAQELVFPNPTYAGEPVEFHLTIVDADAEHRTRSVETQLRRADGEVTCQSLTQICYLPCSPSIGTGAAAISPPDARSWKGIMLGQSAQIQRAFSMQDLEEYCDLVQESSPLYMDISYARENGFKYIPVPGALLGGMFSYLLGTKLPGRGTNWLKQKLYFLEPAYPQDVIVATVEVVRLRPEKDLVNLSTVLRNAQGALVCMGEALVLVKDLEIQASKSPE